MSGAFEILIVLLLILLNGVFALSELAVVSARRARLRQMANEGRRGATTALGLAEEPQKFLSTVQIGITLIGVLAGAFGGATISAAAAERLETLHQIDREIVKAQSPEAIAQATLARIGQLVPCRHARIANRWKYTRSAR